MQGKENGDYGHDSSGKIKSGRLVSRMANIGEESQVLEKGKTLATCTLLECQSSGQIK